ncbi:protease [Halanaeroarchaeum sulfurireducens]|uniref:Protease n=1 Tax=Halanaeroarchaeum sulfurireducens TaxID=1604004 RepID=A0A0F7PBK0_9EURY|nr:protease [Halanaeroarchaeum sulfurireducens]ALG81931.1 protease [Halanaeroarchaeum sulfurireducens]
MIARSATPTTASRRRGTPSISPHPTAARSQGCTAWTSTPTFRSVRSIPRRTTFSSFPAGTPRRRSGGRPRRQSTSSAPLTTTENPSPPSVTAHSSSTARASSRDDDSPVTRRSRTTSRRPAARS